MDMQTVTDAQSFTALNAIRFWEPRRLIYNLLLSMVAIAWIVFTWPHFRPAFALFSLVRICILAFLANLCYCAAYLTELPAQALATSASVRRWRSAVWVAGMVFAILLENYWIADEIYPFVS